MVKWPLGDVSVHFFIIDQVKPFLGVLFCYVAFLYCFLAAKRSYWVQTQMWTDEATGSSAEAAGIFF